MPEVLEESIAVIKEETAHVADSGESSDSAVADERQAEPVIECHESTALCSDKLQAAELSDSVSDSSMVDESVAVLEEPVAVLEEPVAVVEEPVAVVEEPAVAVSDETGALHDEPAAEPAAFEFTSEDAGLADEPIELPPIEEQPSVLADPIAEVGDQCSVEAAAEAQLVADQVSEIHDEAAQVEEADAVL